jgi:hypothetical protein
MTTPTFTPPPAVIPARGSSTFPTDASAWVTWQNGFEGELTTAMPWVAARVVEVAADTATASAAETAAVGAANFKGAWSTLTGALAIPASVSHVGKIWVLLVDLADVTASEPSVTADWLDVSASSAPSYQDAVVVLTGTTPAVDLSAAGEYRLTTTGDTTFTVSNPPPDDFTTTKTLRITQGATAYTLTFWAGIEAIGGAIPAAPALNQTKEYTLRASTVSGTTIYVLTETGVIS